MKGDVPFNIYLPGQPTCIGQIARLHSGTRKEFLTDADNFGAKFPLDLDPRMKAVLLGAVFIIVSFVALDLSSHCLLLSQQFYLLEKLPF